MSRVQIKSSDIFMSDCKAIVCPTNCFGVMGAGLAKQFKVRELFREANKAYNQRSEDGSISPGSCWAYLYDSEKCNWIIYFATKFHFTDNSKLEWIENGLINLRRCMDYYDLDSVALPAIGCGLGGLPYSDVELVVKEVFENDGKNNLIELYQPK